MRIRGRALSLLVAAAVCALLVVSGVRCTGGGGGDGTIEISGSGVTIELSGPKTLVVKSGQSATAPAGTYKATRIRVVAAENAGGQAIPWTVEGEGPVGELDRIKVRSGKTTTVKVGAPFTVRAKTTETGSGAQREIEIEMELIGVSGEQYSHDVRRGTSVVPPARCRVVDRNQRVLTTPANLSYG